MTWKNGRQLDTLTDGTNNVSYSYDSNSVRISKTVNGVKYTYAYINGLLMYETRGDAKFWYSYDANGTLYNVKYTLTDDSTTYSYFYTHNSRGDIVGIYSGSGVLTAHYEYDAWGNVISITDQNGNAITSSTHIGNLNPFRYRGYYLDTESGLYYLMSRYYDPVTHRFINADGYFQAGGDILDGNMSAYCANNPIMNSDPSGQWFIKALIKFAVKNVIKPIVKTIKNAMSKVNATYTSGINISGSPSAFAFGVQGGVSIDTKGNVAIQRTFSTGITGGSPGVAVTASNTITNAPNINSLNGMSYQIGGSGGAAIEGVPVVAIADFNFIPTATNDDLYYGGTVEVGLGTPGLEGHITMSNTVTWDETKFNIFDIAEKIDNAIEEW